MLHLLRVLGVWTLLAGPGMALAHEPAADGGAGTPTPPNDNPGDNTAVDAGTPDGGAGSAPRSAVLDVFDPSVPEDVARRSLLGARVESVEIVAPPGVDAAAAQQLLGINAGDALDASQVRRAVRRLVLLGQVADVRVWAVPLGEGADSVRLHVHLVGARTIREVRFNGLRDVDVQGARRALQVAEGDAADDALLDGVVTRLVAWLRDEGYPQATAQGAFVVLPDQPSAVALQLAVQMGRPRKTSEVVLEGDLRFPRHELMGEVDPVFPPGKPSLGRGGLASASRLKAAAERLQKFYFRKGHYSARVEPRPIAAGTDGAWVPLVLNIRAGPRWVVAFRGNRAISSTELRRGLPLPPDRPMDADVAAGLEEHVRKVYRNVGYLHVQVSVRAAPGTEKGTRRMLFTIREGPFVEVRTVTVKGARGTPFSAADLENEAMGAASEGITSDLGILQRMDLADVEAMLGSGDSERWSHPQEQDPRVGRAHGYTEWPRTLFGRLADEERVYDQERWERGTRALEDALKSRGHLQPRVQGPLTTYRVDGRLVDVQYVVNAGVQTRVRSVSFRGLEALDSLQLLEVIQRSEAASRLDLGKPLDLFSVEEARQALVQEYAERGYPFARVTDDVSYDKARRDADITFVVEEGPLVTLGGVMLRGNRSTRDIVIRDQLTVKAGQVYDVRNVEETRRRLMGLGLFSSVNVELAAGEQGTLRNLVVAVRERDYWDVDGSLGIGAETGPRAFGSVTQRNVAGMGVLASVRLRINYPLPMYFTPLVLPEQRDKLVGRFDNLRIPELVASPLGISDARNEQFMRVVRPGLFTEIELTAALGYPRMILIPTNPGIRSEFIAVRANRFAFSLTKAGLVFSGDIKAPPLKYLRASSTPSFSVQANAMQCDVQTAVDQTGRTCGDDPTRLTRRLDNGVLGLATLRLPVTLDGRDNIFRPHAGYIVTGTADLVVGGGFLWETTTDGNSPASATRIPTQPVRSSFVRLAGGATGYLPLTRAFTLAVGGRAGVIVPMGPQTIGTPVGDVNHYVPLFERFYLGGSDSVRGFTPDGVLASDDPNAAPEVKPRPLVSQGGSTFWNVRTELRFPLAGPLEGGIFLDAGQLLIASPVDWVQDPGVLNPALLSAGVGAGIRLNTPVGPLVLDLGYGFLDGARGILQDGDLGRRFQFHPALGYF